MPDTQQHTSLSRRLTSAQVSMIGLSGALGTGLFLGSGSTIALGGPATVISYALAGLMALSVVWALAEMVTVHPVPGGHGAVAASYLGKFGGYITRWNFAFMMLIAVGAEVTATATYLRFWLPDLPLGLGTILCSLFIVGLNLATVRLYGSSEYWFSLIKVTAISVFIVLGIILIFVDLPDHPAAGFSNLTAHGGFAPYGLGGILAAACMAVFSFGGIENVSVGAAESENPERDVPRAARNMIWRLLLFYIVAMLIIVTLQPWTTSAASHGTVLESPFVAVLDATGIPAAAHIMNAVLIVAALSAANGCLYSSSRMIHSLALDGMAPRWAARTSESGAPRGAVLIATLGMVLASILSLVSPDSAFMQLYGAATAGALVTWIIVMITHMVFRQKRARAGLPITKHHLWGAPAVPILVIVAAVAIFIAMLWILPAVWIAGIPYLVILVASYLILARVRTLATPRNLLAEELR
ncbi:MAG: amino acid permease [Ancrocorticia populi]|uniref:amino acid permease n=1 Tax=Ancrocorticia populi TaxID=2175228 RepID=UPI003F912018